ncbi:MAG: type 1 glutamine amidotransferase domain-containing protein [Rhodanobacteraceae bacterium]
MSQPSLNGRKVAILAADGFEQSELQKPKQLLEDAGASTFVIAPGDAASIKGWKHTDWGDAVKVDVPLAKAKVADYDALVLPGGVINPDKLRLHEDAIKFIKDFGATGKPIAAICHGPWTLINAGLVDGKQVTSWPSLKIDLTNAGAQWEDSEVVVDGNLITSRKPDDIPVFANALIAAIAEREVAAA